MELKFKKIYKIYDGRRHYALLVRPVEVPEKTKVMRNYIYKRARISYIQLFLRRDDHSVRRA
jgi:hypothetical protein